jgi:hypothetical protein
MIAMFMAEPRRRRTLPGACCKARSHASGDQIRCLPRRHPAPLHAFCNGTDWRVRVQVQVP